MAETKQWWLGYPWRMVQTNLREIDMEKISAEEYVKSLKDFHATVVLLNAAGMIASYDTKLAFHTKSRFLHGDSLASIVDACHDAGIKVICRTDFSKVDEKLVKDHPEWAYLDKNGDMLIQNGYASVCVNGEYQQKYMFDILEEVLTEIPFDGLFCNMSGFLTTDYNSVFHGPCHCENCKRRYKEMFGTDIPELGQQMTPDFGKYMMFANRCSAEHKARMYKAVKEINPNLAINGLDYVRSESASDWGRPSWVYSASSNSRLGIGGKKQPVISDNAAVEYMGFRQRHAAVSPQLQALRQYENLANSGDLSLYIIGLLSDHKDTSALELTREVYKLHSDNEKLFVNQESAAKVMLFKGSNWQRTEEENAGFIDTLTASHIPFDEMTMSDLKSSDQLEGKSLVILPNLNQISADAAAVIDEFAIKGGTVLASGASAFTRDKKTGAVNPLLNCLGIGGLKNKRQKLMSSMFEIKADEAGYFKYCQNTPFIPSGDEVYEVTMNSEAKGYLSLIPEHPFGPPECAVYGQAEDVPGLIVNDYGAGRGIYIPFKAGAFYYGMGFENHFNFLRSVLFGFARASSIAPGLNPMVEVTAKYTTEGLLVQLVNESGCFSGHFYKPMPAYDITLDVTDYVSGSPVSARTINGGNAVLHKTDGRSYVKLDKLNMYEGIVVRRKEK